MCLGGYNLVVGGSSNSHSCPRNVSYSTQARWTGSTWRIDAFKFFQCFGKVVDCNLQQDIHVVDRLLVEARVSRSILKILCYKNACNVFFWSRNDFEWRQYVQKQTWGSMQTKIKVSTPFHNLFENGQFQKQWKTSSMIASQKQQLVYVLFILLSSKYFADKFCKLKDTSLEFCLKRCRLFLLLCEIGCYPSIPCSTKDVNTG